MKMRVGTVVLIMLLLGFKQYGGLGLRPLATEFGVDPLVASEVWNQELRKRLMKGWR